MVQIDCNRSSAIYSCVIAFFFLPSVRQTLSNSRREDRFDRFRSPIFFNFPRCSVGILCNFSGSWRSYRDNRGVRVPIDSRWMVENSRARPLAVEILFEPWRVEKSAISRWNDERAREGMNISRGRNNAE